MITRCRARQGHPVIHQLMEEQGSDEKLSNPGLPGVQRRCEHTCFDDWAQCQTVPEVISLPGVHQVVPAWVCQQRCGFGLASQRAMNMCEYHECQIDLYYLILSKKPQVARNTRNLSVEQSQTVSLIINPFVFLRWDMLRLGNINQLFRACHRHHSATILASLHRGCFWTSFPIQLVSVLSSWCYDLSIFDTICVN